MKHDKGITIEAETPLTLESKQDGITINAKSEILLKSSAHVKIDCPLKHRNLEVLQ
jgi:uncharacterized protein (DUF2345 family)